jgi:F-type H+-transporting ATPase subunit a
VKNAKLWIAILVLIVIAVLVKIFIPFETTAVQASVAIAPEVLFEIQLPFALPLIGSVFPISNTLLTTWIVMILIALLAFLSTRGMTLLPGGLQNIMEMLIEWLAGLSESVAGPERGRKFFTIPATIFILVLFSNLMGLIPGFGPIGIISLATNQQPPNGILILGNAPSAFVVHQAEGGVPVLAPFVRAPSTDVNLPLALALIAMVMVEFYGIQMLGLLHYLGKFFNFKRLGKFVMGLIRGKLSLGDLGFGLIDAFAGLVELFSELGKVVAFTFRLFGNIFAGEVVLLIMSFLFLLLPFVFYGLELFVAVIQAFVFCVLAIAFMTIATTPHAGEADH